jgi:tRNA(Ile)-lysidine synthetase-like protein
MLPQWDQIFGKRSWRKGFLLAHTYLAEDTAGLNQMAEALCADPQKLALHNVSQPTLLRRAIQFWLRDCSLSRSCFEQILGAVLKNSTAVISLDHQTTIKVEQGILQRRQKVKNVPKISFKNWQNGELYLPTGYKLTREIVPFSPEQISLEPLNTSTVYVDERQCSSILLRPWQPGDRYKPINAPQKSLKKLFSEKKIPEPIRHQLPVLCDAQGNIFWVPGLPPADFVKVQKDFALRIIFSSTEVKISMG